MPAPSLHGHITIAADDLEAFLNFAPSPEGVEITTTTINKLVADHRLPAIPAKKAEELLFSFAKAKENQSVILLRGTAPEPGRPEEVEWEALDTPEGYQGFLSEALADAGPPALFKISSERIAHERMVKKSGIFGKVEKIVEYEKIERKEAVQVDTQVLRCFWVAAETSLGRVDPPSPGRPGKTIAGKPIPAPTTDDTSFYLGDGLIKDKNIIRSSRAGFVRIGPGWADLLPFEDHSWEVTQSPNGTTVLLNFKAGHRRMPMPDLDEIQKAALEFAEAAECLIDQEEMERSISAAIRNGSTLNDFHLSCERDAAIQISISDDKLKATLTIVKSRGKGKPLELSAISSAIGAARLKGLKNDTLKKDILEFYHSSRLELAEYLLAEGKAPTSGKDRTLTYSIGFLPEEQKFAYIKLLKEDPALSRFCRTIDDFGLDDVLRLGFVKVDQEIARFTPPSLGAAGVDVLGTILPALPGNDPVVWPFENVRLNNESLDSMENGLVLIGEKDEETLIRVLPFQDAKITVTVDEQARTAKLDLSCEYGLGRPLSLERVQAALKDEGVSYGIDLKSVSSAIADAKESQAVSGRVVAQAREPVPAGGFRLHWMLRLASGSAVTVRTDGSADFKNQDRATIVTVDQPVLRLEQIGQEGQDGVDVAGRIIRAPRDPRAGEAPTWDASFRVEKLENGDQMIIAARSGELKFEKNSLSIDAIQKIKGDIGANTGNLKFPGPVGITGSILNGYAVIAGGDVIIGASVEAALVSADGSVKITEGIKGARKGTIRARKTIEASFAEQATLLAVEDITLKSSALLCNIKTNGKVRLLGEKGNLVGGICRARKGVELQNLGSDKGIKTQISFGQDYLMHDLIETEEKEIDKLKALLLQTDRKLRELERIGGNPDKTRQDKLKMLKLLEKRGIRLIELREKFDEYHPGEIIVRGAVHAGVILESHNRFHEIRTTKEKVMFTFDPQLGRIMELPLK